jgi:4-hydroxy-tetrahydrodipicolinate reductase
MAVRAIVYGVGAMGSIVARLLLDKGVEIVGAVARSPAKVGRDLGEVAGLGRAVGVTVDSDARPALERGADVAVVSVASYLHVMADHFRLCLEHGANVVTIEEEAIYPWTTAPELAAELDRVAKEHGVTLAASGAQDVFWMKLVATLMGASHRIESVRGRCSWNADDYGPEVTAHVHAGASPEEFELYVREHGWPDFVARATLEALVADTGLTLGSVSSTVSPVLASVDTPSHSMGITIPAGRLLGVVDATTVETAEGPSFTFEMAGRIYGPGEADQNEWLILGEPELHLRNDRVPTRLITCTTVVNRIPDVIAADPGLVTLDRLPQPRYRHHALDVYVGRAG